MMKSNLNHLAVTLFVFIVVPVFATTIYVDQGGNGDYTSIQPALNATGTVE